MKKIIIIATVLCCSVIFSGCESPEHRMAREMKEQLSEQTTTQEVHDEAVETQENIKYAIITLPYGREMLTLEGDVDDITTYSHGIVKVKFKRPVKLTYNTVTGSKTVEVDTVGTYSSNVFLLYNS